MSTCGQIIDQTLLRLSGYSVSQDQSTAITSSIDNVMTTVSVADASQLSRGMGEIDSEIVFIESADQTANVATVVRGFRSTTATAHSSPARLVMSPLFYRSSVFTTMNDAIGAMYPALYATGTTTFVTNGTTTTYPLPVGAISVMDIKWRNVGPTQEWSPVRRWAVDNTANLTYFPTGASVSVWDGIPSGRTVQVVYTYVPTRFSLESDLFSATGLPATCEDVVKLGALWRLVPNLDTPHIAGSSAEADFSANMRPVGSAQNASRFFLQQYQMRLQEEAARLNNVYPVRVHFTN